MPFKTFLFLFICLFSGVICKALQGPVIGIITQPGTKHKNRSYLPASYVKFIEQGGAQVIPLVYGTKPKKLLKILSKLNGIILPGGHSNEWVDSKGGTKGSYHSELSNFSRFSKFIVDYVEAENDKGRNLPLLGICLGFETIILALSGTPKSVKLLNSPVHKMSTLNFLSNKSRLFSSLSKELFSDLQKKNLAYFSHNHGLLLKDYYTIPNLRNSVRAISYSVSPGGEKYVSSFEANEYPIYGVQFHLEKSNFEWNNKVKGSHDPESIEFSQKIANFFVGESKKVEVLANSRFMKKKSILNYKPVYTHLYMYLETYFFPKPLHTHIWKENEYESLKESLPNSNNSQL